MLALYDYYNSVKDKIVGTLKSLDTFKNQKQDEVMNLASQQYNKYIKSPTGEMFPEATWKKPQEEQNKIWQEYFTNLAFGASSPLKPVASNNAVQIATRLGQKLDKGIPLSMEDYGSLQVASKDALGIGRNMTKKQIKELTAQAIKESPGDIVPNIERQEIREIRGMATPHQAETLGDIKKSAQAGEVAQQSFSVQPKGVEATLYHGTTPENAQLIRKQGFSVAKSGQSSGGAILGEGVYLDKTGGEGAKLYGQEVLQTKIKPGLKLWKGDIESLYTKETNYGDPTKITQYLKSKGFDGVEGKGQVVIFDPKNVTTPPKGVGGVKPFTVKKIDIVNLAKKYGK